MMQQTPLMSLENISLFKNRKSILDGVSFDLFSGKITTIIGPNGAGKTSLLRVMLGLTTPTSGKIHKRANLSMGYMPQKITITPLLPLTVAGFLKLSTKIIDDTYVKSLHVEHLLTRQLHHLSGGELQKILLLQAISSQPELLVLDEPTQGLDVLSQAGIHDFITCLAWEKKMSIVHVSHDLHVVMAKSDEVICLNHHMCCAGKPEDVQKHPKYLNLFGPILPITLAPYHHHHDHIHDAVDGCDFSS